MAGQLALFGAAAQKRRKKPAKKKPAKRKATRKKCKTRVTVKAYTRRCPR